MLEWWSELPPWLRLGVAFGLIITGGLVFWYVDIRVGIVLMGLGLVLWLVGGPTDPEKKGYRF